MLCRDDLDFIAKMVDKTAIERLQHVASTPFKRLTYSDAIEILEGVVRDGKKKFEFPVSCGSDAVGRVSTNSRCSGWLDVHMWRGTKPLRLSGRCRARRLSVQPGDTPSVITDHLLQVKWGIDLASEHERYLTEEVFRCPASPLLLGGACNLHCSHMNRGPCCSIGSAVCQATQARAR